MRQFITSLCLSDLKDQSSKFIDTSPTITVLLHQSLQIHRSFKPCKQFGFCASASWEKRQKQLQWFKKKTKQYAMCKFGEMRFL